jgi:prolyl oligopeptidase
VGVPALFYKSALKYDAELLVDPNFISRKDKIMLKGYYVSGDSKLLAYQFSRNGSDWAEVKVVNLQYATHKEDHLTGLKFSDIAWLGNGFYYSTVFQDSEFGETIRQQVYYHEIGTEQKEDKLIFERKNNPKASFDFLTTSNERYFVLKEKDEQVGKVNVFYIDYNAETPYLRPLILNLKENIYILDSHEGKFIVETIHDSKKGSIVEIDPANPYNWRSIIPEYAEALLMYIIPFADRLVTVYQLNQHPILAVYDYEGSLLYKLDFPVATSLGGFNGEFYDEELLFNYASYTIPPVVYKFNIKNFQKELTKQTTVTFDFNKIVYKEVEYLSEDSIRVPMILVYEKGLELNGENPTILKAYGGFGSVEQPYFDPGIVYFVKKGGVFAFANIRGGGDKGIDWARDGRGDKKQNSFDDFIAAAEYLINSKYTNSEKLAITGASNGGLVVAAAAMQRPDLFKAVVPVVAPLDMLRFEKFTIGHFHTDEYGTVQDSSGFKNLFSYSPYHNIKQDVNYPSFLIVTAENDDRVPPFHSYKFTARMQNRAAQTNPIMLKTEKKAGHNGANTFYSTIEETADIFGFIMNELSRK